jgi:tetratricopeptide (TPR) repeat protein
VLRSRLLIVTLLAALAAAPAYAKGAKPPRPPVPKVAPSTTPGAPPAPAADGDFTEPEVHLSDGPTDPANIPKQAGIPYYEELAKKTPDDPQVHQQLAAAYARAGKTDDARREARRTIELAPNDPEAHQSLALIEEGAGNLTAAEQEYRKATTLDGNVEYRLDLARALFLEGKIPEAQDTWDKIGKDFEKNGDVEFALADAMKELGRYEDASIAYDRALALADPKSERAIDILIEQARMVADRGNNIQAIELLKRASEESPDNPEVAYNLGVIYLRLANTDAAIKQFQAAIKKKPELAKAHNNLGVALDKAGKHDEAMASFQKAVDADSRFADALYNLGVVSFKLKKWNDARSAFEKALKVEPNMADAKFYLGEVYYMQGDKKKALSVYKEAVHSHPDDASSHRRLGDIYLEQGDKDVAIGEYSGAVDADERDSGNRAQLMRVLLARNNDGDIDRASKLGERGLDLDPTSLELREMLAQAEVLARRSVKAREILEAGVKVSPADPRTHVALAKFLLDQGTKDSQALAQQELDDALKLDPKCAPALAASGALAEGNGDSKRAMQMLTDALAVDPTLAEVRAERGRMLFLEDKNPEALKELKRATDDAPKLGKAWFYLAFAQRKAGQGQDVVEKSLKKAVEDDPDLAEAHMQLGCFALEKKNIDEAKKHFTVAARAPGHEDAQTYLELIANGAPPARCTSEKK